MRVAIFVLLAVIEMGVAEGQALQEINFQYLYNLDKPYSLNMQPTRSGTTWRIHYDLQVKAPNDTASWKILWELRSGFSEKDGARLTGATEGCKITEIVGANRVHGVVELTASDGQLLVARVANLEEKVAWFQYLELRPDFPGQFTLFDSLGNCYYQKYLEKESRYRLEGIGDVLPRVVTFYSVDFPAAAPAFSTGLARVPGVLSIDSTYRCDGGDLFVHSDGVYLVQQDTAQAQGSAYIAFEEYPRYTSVSRLADPLIYICTRSEFEKLQSSKGDKKAFDRILLSILGGDAGRARLFMKSYFRRVELANRLFTSFKEGWKTDRGMISIIFGIPNDVRRFKDREVWTYEGSVFSGSFTFVRSGTLFDADSYVLIRDDKYRDKWYEIVDLWRSARFQ